uniref:Retrovirus-related Pol polyprotein from transposon TNT 1-94 n=1 Tax=Cannabis sativa TaxID=3483 RepID=A0A803PZM7_CANSA
MQEIKHLKLQLKMDFEMKDLTLASKILGMDIRRERRKRLLYLNQMSYIGKVPNTFEMSNSKKVSTQLAQHFKLSATQMPKDETKKSEMLKVPYASVVGSLMYVMVCTRPSIAYALSMVSRFIGNPRKEHWEDLKWILRYSKGSIEKGLVFGMNKQSEDLELERKPSKGGGIVDNKSRVYGLDRSDQGGPLVNWIDERVKTQPESSVHCDNQSAIQLTKNYVHHECTKHIDIKFHFIREVVEKEAMKIVKVLTEDNHDNHNLTNLVALVDTS